MALHPVTPSDVDDLRSFLDEMDLTLAGLDDPTVRLWTERAHDGAIVGSTGYEASSAGEDVLIRSVAVAPTHRSAGAGTRLARFAIQAAAHSGARRAWLFSRRSGPFWRGLGFEAADRAELATVLEQTHQVRLFVQTGQLAREVAWSRDLADRAG
jgi:N-acetylglutamate synthase-like GNAT family acetyltransferase